MLDCELQMPVYRILMFEKNILCISITKGENHHERVHSVHRPGHHLLTVLIFDHDGQIKSRAYPEFTQYYPKPGWVEHDAEEIWLVTIKVIAEALHNANIRATT